MKVDLTLWSHLLPLLDEALQLPAVQREPWVRALDIDAPAKEALLQLLADRAQIEDGGFLDALPRIGGAETGDARAALSAGHSGESVGAYRLLREIGRGGMSVVWLAERDDGQLRRQVALKFPHAGPDQAALVDRMRRERDILAALEHRNIARLYDVGTTADGVPFLVLEYVEGETLIEHCNARRLPIAQRLQLFIQVLRAVQHAHGSLVLHRDVKPSNILVNAAGDVKLLDFGIAKLLTSNVADATELTRHGGRVLTPDYAAPEQIAGTAVSTATDVYALGVVLFELLTGARPYRLPRHSVAALEEAILTSEPKRPSDACQASTQPALYASTPARMRRALRGDLDLIVLTALQKSPERRYATADAFEQDIRRHLARQPVLAQPDSRWYRLRKFLSRNLLAVSATGAVVLALGIGLGAALWQAGQTRLEAAKANAVKDFLIGLFESNSVEQADALRKRQQSVQSLLEESARSLQTGLAGQPLVRDEMQAVVGRLLHDLYITDPAVDLRRRRVEGLESLRADLPTRVIARHELADSLAQQGEAKAASQALEEAVALCPPPSDAAPVACLAASVAQGLDAVRDHRLQAAAASIEPAVQALLGAVPRSAEAADGLAALGEVRALQNRADDAYRLFQQAADVRTALWGPQSARLARTRYDLAMNLWTAGRRGLAESELAAAMGGFAASLGPEHPTTALVELQLGRLRSWTRGGGQEETAHATRVIEANAVHLPAEKVFDAQLVRLETLLFDGRIREAGDLLAGMSAPATPADDIAYAYDMSRVWFLQVTGRFDDARSILRPLRDKSAGALGDAHPYVADLDLRLAGIDASEERHAEARAGFERVRQSQDAREEAFDSFKHRAATALARIDMDQGRFDKAWPLISANFERARRTPREEQFAGTVNDLNDRMGQVLAGLGRPAEARPHFESAIAALEKGYAYNPTLAVVRAHFASCLIQLGEPASARTQLAMAEAALREEPQAGPQYRQAVRRVQGQLNTAAR